MASVYIIFSESLNSFYVGFTSDKVSIRLNRHNTDYYQNKFTFKGKPWVLFLEIECESVEQARKIESHIKKMKSRAYIFNLKKYPEMVQKLIEKYKD